MAACISAWRQKKYVWHSPNNDIKFGVRVKDVILDNVINIDKELRKVGIENPLIAVAGLNPHNGDNGLFGTEEITDIGPAVEAAKAELGDSGRVLIRPSGTEPLLRIMVEAEDEKLAGRLAHGMADALAV